jgi:hypothetical protein
VRLTPRPDELDDSQPASQDFACSGDAANEAGEIYFENLRKKIRFDDGGKGIGPKLDYQEQATDRAPADLVKPFHGLIVYINKKVEDGHFELVKAVESLGGEIRYQHCQEVTHYVFQGKLPNGTKEVKQAREWHQKFVSPQWILDSEDAAKRLDENHYPTSFNPSMTLSLSYTQTPSQATSIPIGQQKKRQGDTPRSQRKRRAEDDGLTLQPTLKEDEEENAEEEANKMAVFEELLQVNENLSRASEQLIPVARKAPAVRLETGPVFIPATQVPVEAPESQTQVAWDLQNEKPAPSSYRVMLSG